MSRLAPLSAAVAAATLLAVAAGGGPAVAKPIDSGTIHEEYSFVLTDFCGVDGLDVDFAVDIDIDYAVRSKGSAQLPSYSALATGTRTFTNPENGRVVTEVSNVLEKELRVTDNGDGTFTVLLMATGNSTFFGMDGKAIARNPGQVRDEVLIDNNDTPQDPTDDEFLEYLGEVKGSTGRTDDVCAAIVAELT